MDLLSLWAPTWGPLLSVVGIVWSMRLLGSHTPKPDPATKADVQAAFDQLDCQKMAEEIAAELAKTKCVNRSISLASNIRLHYDARLEVW